MNPLNPVRGAALVAAALTAHTAYNLRRLRVPPADPPAIAEPVSVLLPLRDEVHRVEPCLRALLAQRRLAGAEIIVLDDGSTDGTAELVRSIARGDPRVRLLTGAPPPPGRLGKPHACAQLAAAARGSVYVFIDADVVLTGPHAVAAAVTCLRAARLDLVSPYPRLIAEGPAERLVQPLLPWSWLTTLPLDLAERSPRESLAAAGGQFLVVDAAAYRRAGGHDAVADQVLEDIALLRAVKRSGGRGVVADGTLLASCRMYEGWAELRSGYTKSLWSAFGPPAAAAGTIGLLGWVYVLPPLAALRGSRAGLAGYAAAVTGRVLTARRMGDRVWPDVLAQPASIGLLGWLTALSWRDRRHGRLEWKGRVLYAR